jgi:UDP-2-acetamido-3-amino-2,3-dideoxy-glucuronate N-acetyltransferase
MSMNMVNVAVAGAGYWGKNLVRNFKELGVLHTICDSNPAILKTFQDEYPGKEFQNSFQVVLQNPDVNAVVIATPAETHFEMVRSALLANKHVFVEKPLAMIVSEAEELHQLALRQNLKLMVGHILLYHPAIIKLKEIINSGELGKINYVYSNRLNLGKIRSEENILWSFAPHDISAILYLLEEMPSRVVAQGGNYLNHDIADVTISVLSFKSGVKGHIFVSWLHPNKEQKLIIVGDKKMAVFDDTLIEGKLQIHDKGVEWIKRQPVLRKNGATIIPIEAYEPLKAECKHFLECIETGTVPESDGINGIKVLNVLNACQKSLELHGAVIPLRSQKSLMLQKPQKLQGPRNGYNNPIFLSELESNILLSHHSAIPRVERSGTEFDNFFVHETAIVDSPFKIGKGTKIWNFSHIMPGVQIGNDCNIGQNVIIASCVKIGNNVKIKNNVSVYSGVTIEDDVSCGPSVVFANATNTRSHIHKKHEFKSTRVKKGATIDANATIVCGSTIGSHAFIEAGAVITKDVPNHSLVLGNPARIVGWVCECLNHLDFHNDIATCGNCKKQFIRHEGGIRCIGCECGNLLNFKDDITTCDDCKKQPGNCKEDNKYHEKDWKLPQAAGFVQYLK